MGLKVQIVVGSLDQSGIGKRAIRAIRKRVKAGEDARRRHLKNSAIADRAAGDSRSVEISIVSLHERSAGIETIIRAGERIEVCVGAGGADSKHRACAKTPAVRHRAIEIAINSLHESG